MAAPAEPDRRGLVQSLVVACAAVAVQLPSFDRWMSLMDEGHILMFAELIANGGELYRDATLLPLPGAFYLLAAAFRIFEPSILLARWIVVIEFAAFAVIVFQLVRQLSAHAATAWTAVLMLFVYRVWSFPHWHMYSYSTLALVLQAGALLGFARFLANGNRWLLALAGLLTGLSVFTKQDYGVAGLVALCLALGLRALTAARGSDERRGADFVWLVAPAALVGAATALHFLSQGLFLEMLRQTLLNHLIGIGNFEYTSLPPLLPLFDQEPLFRTPFGFAVWVPAILFSVDWQLVSTSALYREGIGIDLFVKLFFYGPYLVVAAGLARGVVTRAALRNPETRLRALREQSLYLLALFLLLAFNKPVDWVHLVILWWPLLALLCVYADALARSRPRAGLALVLVLSLPLAASVAYSARLTYKLREKHDTPLRTERAGVFVTELEESVIGEAVDWVASAGEPDEPIAVLPYFPLISFLAERPGPHRSTYIFWPVEDVPGREAQIIEELERRGSEAVLYHVTQWVQFPRMDVFAPELFGYLVEHFEFDEVFSDVGWGYMLVGLRREAAPPPGEPILEPGAGNARLFVDGAAGMRQVTDADERDELLAAELWPFRPAVALKPLSDGRRTVLSVPVEVPPGARLESAVSVKPVLWFRFPPSSVEYAVHAVHRDGRDELFRTRLDPHRDRGDRRWEAFSLPLDAYAGQRIELEFSTAAEVHTGEAREMGGFEWPRLVTRPDPGPAGARTSLGYGSLRVGRLTSRPPGR